MLKRSNFSLVVVLKCKMKIVLGFLVIFLVNSALSSEPRTQVHHKLSDDQFKNIFRRERRDVPDYKFVNIKPKTNHRTKRELRPVEFEVDEKKIELNLQPAEHQVMSSYIPVWRANSNRGHQYNYQAVDPEEKKIDGIFYEDREKMATLLAYYKDHYIHYDGIFGEDEESKVVKAAPEDWRHHSVSEAQEGNHFVFNVASKRGEVVTLTPRELDSIPQRLIKPLETFYPKLLVIVDYSLFKTLGKDVQETVKYMATFWNAVNLKYSKIEKPKIRIIVTGLIISEDPNAMDYIARSRNHTDSRKINPFKLLPLAGNYFHDEFSNTTRFDNYDATITLANLNAGATLGVAYQGEICSDRLNVGYVGDDGNYGGVLTATHELGHLLGLPHDGQNGCEGYPEDKVSSVMAPGAVGVKEYFWSSCSEKSLQKFAWSKKSLCMEKRQRHRK